MRPLTLFPFTVWDLQFPSLTVSGLNSSSSISSLLSSTSSTRLLSLQSSSKISLTTACCSSTSTSSPSSTLLYSFNLAFSLTRLLRKTKLGVLLPILVMSVRVKLTKLTYSFTLHRPNFRLHHFMDEHKAKDVFFTVSDSTVKLFLASFNSYSPL